MFWTKFVYIVGIEKFSDMFRVSIHCYLYHWSLNMQQTYSNVNTTNLLSYLIHGWCFHIFLF